MDPLDFAVNNFTYPKTAAILTKIANKIPSK
jgi:hypothetical protein